jgi:acetyl-CoA C-acetyltransferase
MTGKPDDLVIIGLAASKVGELWDVSLRDLAARVMLDAIADGGGLKPNSVFVGNMLASSASHQANLGALLCEYANLTGAEGVTAEAAEASGGAAIFLACNAVRSGMVDVALAIGVEKVTDVVDENIAAAIAKSLDADYEASQGLTPISQAALLMQRYQFENKFPREALAWFAMIAHANAVGNPRAMYRKAISEASYNRAGMVADPLNLFDVAPYADGAAAVVITRRSLAPKELKHPLVRIASSSLITDRLAIHDRVDPLFFEAAAVSVQKACQKAGVSVADVDFFEYSDNTTLHAILSLEAAGFAPRGQGWKLASDGSLTRIGNLPVATMGGNKARGFPLGAAGVYQAVEAALQLRGEAGDCQISGVKRGMVQTLGGTASTAVTHILEKGDE